MNRIPPRARGLSLGSSGWAVACNDPEVLPLVSDGTRYIPPAILLPSHAGEPLRLDAWYPSHVRGTGQAWPPESRVGSDIGSGRFPIALAWAGRRHVGASWRWNYQDCEAECSPIDAIAQSIATLASNYCDREPVAVTVPNDFRQAEQQTVLDRCRSFGADVALIWAPIAAALFWLEAGEHTLLELSPSASPSLLVIHADWRHVTLTALSLMGWPTENPSRWVPVRDRPNPEVDIHLAPPWLEEQVANKSAENLSDALALLSHQSWQRHIGSLEPIEEAIRSTVGRLGPELAGIIVHGDCARRLAGSSSLRYNAKVRVLHGTEAEAALAKGACQFRQRQLSGEVAYLDSLPIIELFVERAGEYVWLPLLEPDQVVPGGRRWVGKPIPGFSVRRGADKLTLVIAHEEEPGVRELDSKLNDTADDQYSAELHVSIIPAQGNALLDAHLSSSNRLVNQTVHANWKHMRQILHDGKPLDKKQFEATRERAFPPLRPRAMEPTRWLSFSNAARLLLDRLKRGDSMAQCRPALFQVLGAARRSGGLSPVTSEGSGPPGSATMLQELSNFLFEYVAKQGRAGTTLNEATKLLGYISASGDELEQWIHSQIEQRWTFDEPFCILAGNCIRSAKTAVLYIRKLLQFAKTNTQRRLLSYQMQSLGVMLSQRKDVLNLATSNDIGTLMKECLSVFSDQLEADRLYWLFEHSGLVVVYCLRYRIVEADFLPPETELAVRAKGLFNMALQKLRAPSLFRDRRSDRLATALQQLIDYIDKRGTGDILIADDI